MKHLNKKIKLAGAAHGAGKSRLWWSRNRNHPGPGNPYMQTLVPAATSKKNTKHHAKGPEIIPPVYLPPKLGQHQYGASHSYAETIDLLTDGPIEGIVNQNGLLCDGSNILQGIYFNDTPVAVTDNSAIEGYHDIGSITDPVGTLAVVDSDIVADFFKDLAGIGRLYNSFGSGPKNLFAGRVPTNPQQLVNTYYTTSKWRHPEAWMRHYYGRGIHGPYKSFYHTGNGSWPVLFTSTYFSAHENQFQTIAIWTDNATVGDSKFMLSLGNHANFAYMWSGAQHLKYSPWALCPSSEGGHPKCGLEANLNAIYENFYSQTENPHQRELARRVLHRLGAGYPEAPIGGRLNALMNASSTRNVHVVLRPDPDQTAGLAGINLLNGGNLMNYTFKFTNSDGANVFDGIPGVYTYDFLCPEIGTDGTLTGNVEGFILVSFQWNYNLQWASNWTNSTVGYRWGKGYGIPTEVNSALASISEVIYSRNVGDETMGLAAARNIKYNYSNVLAEFRYGTEEQMPLKFFNKIFIDQSYGTPLYGPYIPGKVAQRIAKNVNMLQKAPALHGGAPIVNGLPTDEGSEDKRGAYDYANWAQESLPDFEEDAINLTHIVINPNVESVFVTLEVAQLHDTLHTALRGVGHGGGNMSAGASLPSILNMSITTGLIDSNGKKTPHKTRNYRILALIQASTLIDIGNPDGLEDAFTYVKSLDDESLVTPLPLPPISQDYLRAHQDADLNQSVVVTPASHVSIRRYVEVERLSTETNSVLISKSVTLSKITEIIPINVTYPFSTLVGTKIDSRSFGNIPTRSYDCKLKKVKVPANYEPLLTNGVDKRYFDTQGEFDERPKQYKQVYKGDWDGTFNENLQWTDNPAWILYDLLTSTRYGMGQHIEEKNINKWQLYEIGRFCDAVDDNGYFLGVPDGHGGREPRFACNIVFDGGKKIYDALNTIVGLFRGAIFFNNGEINFADDRPRETVDLFTNDTVKGGLFHYANNRRDQSYNTIEVTYTDRFDSYVPKVEVVENEEDIRQRGVFKKEMAAIGITSRAMARRAAQHQIFSSLKENQTVAFEAGLETLLCQPGDLIIIEDELKTLKENFGKILAVNVAEGDQQGTIRLSNKFVDADMTGRLTVYAPTGRDTISEVEDIANQNRQRSLGFKITGTDPFLLSAPQFSGDYNFSGYTAGYPYATGSGSSQFEQYGLYTGTGTGTNINMVCFSTGFTGWVLATGNPFGDNEDTSIWISDYTGSTLYDLGTGHMAPYSLSATDRRGGSPINVSGLFSGNNILDSITRGFLPSEVMLVAPSQTTVLNVTGEITIKDYGCLVSGFDKPEMLPLLKEGSAAKFEIKDVSPFIYKVLGIREANPNEFLVSATKYETGKWNLIENNISVEYKENTFAYNVAQTIGGVTYSTLDPPKWTGIITGEGTEDDTFFISGDFTDPNGGPPLASSSATGFSVVLTGPGLQIDMPTTTQNQAPVAGFCVKFDDLSSVGHYTLNVSALGNQGGTNELQAYFNSSYDQTGLFVLFEDNLQFGRTRAGGLTIG